MHDGAMSDPNAASLPESSAAERGSQPSPVASARGGTSGFALLVGVWMLLLTAFFGASALAMVLRWQRDTARAEVPPIPVAPPLPAPGTTDPSPAKPAPRATVTVPPSKKNGAVREQPSFDAEVVALVPGGQMVDVEDTAMVRGKLGLQRWFRVRTVVFGKPVEGWMHSDILRLEDGDMPER